MNERAHWDAIYRRKAEHEVSWYRPHLDRSVQFIEAAALPADAAIIDIGGGTSTLADDLLERGYTNLTVLDVSETAIARARRRLGEHASAVQWLVADITRVELPAHRFDFWHDRAVFHFLAEAAARRRYVEAVHRALKPNGHIVVATFGPHGPETCSGLPVMRYSAEGIHAEFGDSFRKVGDSSEVHLTPWGSEQEFVYCYCRLSG